MTREMMEKCIAQRAAHVLRAATIRLARERAGEEIDPSLTYGCVDWFRYPDASKSRETDEHPSPRSAKPEVGRSGAAQGH